MKFGNTGSTFTKKLESKSSIKNPSANLNTNLSKDPKKKQIYEGLKKSFAKDINKAKNTITNNTNTNPISATLPKINSKSTPEIGNIDMIKFNDDNKKKEKNEDCYYNSKEQKILEIYDRNPKDSKEAIQENFMSPNLRPNSKNGKENSKNIQLNLWKKPIVGVNTPNSNGNIINNTNIINNEITKSVSKFSKIKINTNNNFPNNNPNIINTMNSKEINLKKGLNFGKSGTIVANSNTVAYASNNNQTNTQILSTNNTDKKEEYHDIKTNREIVVIPINKYLEPTKNTENIIIPNNNLCNYDKEEMIRNICDVNNNKLNEVNNHKPITICNLGREIKNQDIEGKIFQNNNKNFPSLRNNYITNFNTQISIGITKENMQSEILSSILNFKNLLKTNEGSGDIEKLYNSEENLNLINQLNNKLNLFGGIAASKNFNYLQKEKSLVNENNIIKRNTFIENTVNNKFKTSCFNEIYNDSTRNEHNINELTLNKQNEELETNKYRNMNINLISATMLSTQYSPKNSKNQNFSSNKKNNAILNNFTKDKILDEIQKNAEMRIKKYEILIDFINSNLKEINQIVTTTNFNNLPQHRRQATQEILTCRDEFNSNRFSSLHSRINLNSRTNLSNLINDKENICDYEETEMLEKSNLVFPKNRLKCDGSVVLHLDTLKKEESPPQNKNMHEVCPSFFISSINSDYYQNLLEESNCVNIISQINNINNISIEFSNIKAQNETIKKLDRMVSYESDKTPLQYMNVLSNIVKSNDRFPRITENPNHINDLNSKPVNFKSTMVFSKINRDKDKTLIQINNMRAQDVCSPTAYLDYNEGEENLEDSELDKTKENNKIFNFPLPSNCVINKNNERIKFYAHKIPQKILKPSMDKAIKEEPTKIPEEKSSKCTIF